MNVPCSYNHTNTYILKLLSVETLACGLFYRNWNGWQIMLVVFSANIVEQKVNKDCLKCQLCLVYHQTCNSNNMQASLDPTSSLLYVLVTSHFIVLGGKCTAFLYCKKVRMQTKVTEQPKPFLYLHCGLLITLSQDLCPELQQNIHEWGCIM